MHQDNTVAAAGVRITGIHVVKRIVVKMGLNVVEHSKDRVSAKDLEIYVVLRNTHVHLDIPVVEYSRTSLIVRLRMVHVVHKDLLAPQARHVAERVACQVALFAAITRTAQPGQVVAV